jgi:general secretion pathway protein A
VDEAQNLAPEVLEEVRLLTNLETTREKLLQVILIGQPELAALLEQPKLRQLAQRVTARYHLEPLSRPETRAYVHHRLAVAGRAAPLFTEAALRAIHRETCGIPRLINAIADRALLGAYTQERPRVDAATVRRAADEVLGRPVGPWWGWGRGVAAFALIAATVGGGLVLLAPGELDRDEPPRERTARPTAGPSLAALPAPTPGVATEGAPDGRATARLAEFIQDPSLPATKRDALRVLFGLWGVPAAGGRADCEAPPSGSLECLAAVGTWQRLRRLDLPAALELAGTEGERRYAVLTALTASEATLRFGDRVVTALLAEVEPFWEGHFVVLWRPPPGELPVRRGARGPATDWLRERMARADGDAVAIERGRPYDRALWERVVAFQAARALEPDGVVGRETAIVLRRAEWGPGVPRLSPGEP